MGGEESVAALGAGLAGRSLRRTFTITNNEEPFAALGDTVDGPRLGFEIRLQKQPQDPQKWFKKRYR